MRDEHSEPEGMATRCANRRPIPMRTLATNGNGQEAKRFIHGPGGDGELE